jgi:hypothetical protein
MDGLPNELDDEPKPVQRAATPPLNIEEHSFKIWKPVAGLFQQPINQGAVL